MWEVIALDEPDAVLPRRGSLELDRSLHHAMHDPLGDLAFGFVVEDDGFLPQRRFQSVSKTTTTPYSKKTKRLTVEIPVPDVPDNRARQATLGDISLSLVDDGRQMRDRHRHVRGPDVIVVAVLLSHDAPERLLPRAPQVVLLLLVARKVERHAPALLGHLAHERDVLLDRRLRARELEEQRRLLLPRALGRAGVVDAAHLDVVEDLHRRDRHGRSDHLEHAVCRIADGGEAADRDAGVGRAHGDLQNGLGDEAQRAFGPDERPRQVVARGRLARGAGGS